MKTPSMLSGITRRRVLQSAALTVAGLGPAGVAMAQAAPTQADTVRDHLWIFACAANSDYITLRQRSLMTPVESAVYFDVPNLIVVQSSKEEGVYGRLNSPFAQYTVAMRPLKRIVWSVVGSGGFTAPAETREALELAKTTPNFAGLMLDDFFDTNWKQGKRAVWTVDELAETRRQLKQINDKLRIFATFYMTALDISVADYLELIDVLTLWTMDPKQLDHLESNFAKVEKLAPRPKKMLGCYLVDYAQKKSIPLDVMQRQCETGLRWLKEGRIEGIVFLGNTVMDLGYECVEWTRQWIQKVGDTRL
jgi:hypothetical protein